MRFIIVTGLSGAGKTLVLRTLEDLGFFCIDNLPPKLMPKFAELCWQSGGSIDRIALVMDIRSGEFFDDLFECLDLMRESGYTYEILFLEASDNTILRRYKESRRKHPLVKEGRNILGIRLERERLKSLKAHASHIIDTTNLQPKDLKDVIWNLVSGNGKHEDLFISIISFGFKHGALMDADLVFDVRFLPNPFYVESLKKHTGKETVIKDYLFMYPETQIFLDKLGDMLEFLIPRYIQEGKSQLVIGIGCTGGMHRSVTIADALYDSLKAQGHHVTLDHRDIKEK